MSASVIERISFVNQVSLTDTDMMTDVGITPFYKTIKHARAMKTAQLVVSVATTIFVSKTMAPYWC